MASFTPWNVVDREGIAPSSPVCDAGILLLNDQPISEFDDRRPKFGVVEVVQHRSIHEQH